MVVAVSFIACIAVRHGVSQWTLRRSERDLSWRQPQVPLGGFSAARSMPLEVLNGALVFEGCRSGLECAQISAFTGSWICLAGVQAVFAG